MPIQKQHGSRVSFPHAHGLGMTMLELLLVIVIAATVALLGIKQYLVYRNDADVQSLKNNIDMIFSAASRYFYANCRVGTTPPGALTRAMITPNIIVLLSSLQSQGYLDPGFPQKNPLVDSSVTNSDYRIQFNYNTLNRNTCMTTDCSSTQQIGTIIFWKIQVAVKLVNTSKISMYKALLTADCISSSVGGGVASCVPTPSPGPYLVFERLPTSAEGINTRSILAPSLPSQTLQNQSNETAQINYLLDISHAIETQYFYCNG